MQRLVNRVNEIAESAEPQGIKLMQHIVATFDIEIAEMIRRDRVDEPGLLRSCGFTDIADALGL